MKYFAYGAMMSVTHMKQIGVDVSTRVPAYLSGHRLRFEKKDLFTIGMGSASINKTEKKDRVYGALYDLTDAEVDILDEKEEYPTGYTREPVTVMLQSGEKVAAFTYIAHPSMVEENLLPTREYIDLICESVDILPVAYIAEIRKNKTLDL